MEQSLWTRRQILKAAGAAGGLAAASSFLSPGIFLAADEEGQRGETSLGRFGPWSAPHQIAELASTAMDFHPAISRNGLSLYFTTSRFPGFIQAIAVIHRADRDAPWDPSTLANVTPLNFAGRSTGVPNLTPDGHTMYFQSGRPSASLGVGHGHLWVSNRQHNHEDFGPFGWEPPQPVPGTLNTAEPSQWNQSAATYFRDPDSRAGSMYFSQFFGKGTFGDPNQDFDIYVSRQNDDGSFGPGVRVEALEPAEPGEPEPTEVFVKKSSRQTRTAISRDGLEMFITSNRQGGLTYSGDPIENLWVATRSDTSTEDWKVPNSPVLGLNSGFGEGGPALSRDGKTIYFFSARPTTPGPLPQPQNWQLWMSTREKLDD
jgi:hypothetical protein